MTPEDAPALRGAADMHVGTSGLCCERDDLVSVREHLTRSQALGEVGGLPQNRYRWQVAMARLQEAEGDLDGTLERLGEAERLYVGDFFPNVRPVAAMRARLWITQGRWAEARRWVDEQGLSTQGDLTYLSEFGHLTLARLLLARPPNGRNDPAEVMDFLERLLRSAEEGGRTGSVIEILILQALAQQGNGQGVAALVPFNRALTLAEPEGYVRLFIGEGAPMVALLRQAARSGKLSEYVNRLLKASGTPTGPPPVNRGSNDPLSERELEVLRWLTSELNGPDLASQLGVSLNTLRTHTRNIYGKLGVNTRRAAVRRAGELGLS